MLTWRRVGSHGMASECGTYRCGKVYIEGCTLYELWRGERLIATCNDFAEVMGAAELAERGLLP